MPLATPRFPADKSIGENRCCCLWQRRKMLRSALGTMSIIAAQWLEAAGIDPTRRAETLCVEEFCRLANAYKKLGCLAGMSTNHAGNLAAGASEYQRCGLPESG